MGHIQPLSFKVATTLSAWRGVALSTTTANTVVYPGSGHVMPVGITGDTVLETTSAIPVYCAGNIAKLYFNDTVTTGQPVALDTSGRGIPATPAATTTSFTVTVSVIGHLVGPTIAATGTVADVLIMPYELKGA